MEAKKYVPRLIEAAERYRDYLLDRNFLIIGQAPNGSGYSFIEVVFLDRHFMHLTGVTAFDVTNEESDEEVTVTAERFFEMCLAKVLSPDKLSISYQATLKLDVLPTLFNFTRNAKMMGSYNGAGNLLSTEKIAGTVAACIGFVPEPGNPYMVPNTALQRDIRTLVDVPMQVVAIYEKSVGQALYPPRPKYLAKALKSCADSLRWPDAIASRIGQ